MDTSYLYTKTTEQLKLLAKQEGVKLPSGASKAKIIALLEAAKNASGSENSAPDAAEQKTETEKKPRVKAKADTPEAAPKKRGRPAGSRKKTDAAPEEKKEAPGAEKAASEVLQSEAQAEAKPAKRVGRPRKNPVKAPKEATPVAEQKENNDTGAAEAAGEKESIPAIENTSRAAAAAREEAKGEAADGAENAMPEASQVTSKTEENKENAADAEDSGEEKDSSEEERSDNGEKPAEAEKPADSEKSAPAGDWGEGKGVLEILPDGYGFLRAENCLPGTKDVYLSQTQIRRFNLRNGDYITGKTRPQRDGDRYEGMIFVSTVNGMSADAARRRPRFEELTPIFPNSRLSLENPLGSTDLALRTIDLIAPIGKGQRGLIVSPPKAGKTVLLKLIANAITANYPGVELMVLLIDERPEEVTDMQRSTHGEVFYSTFDEAPENHTRLSEMVLDKAMRQVEMGKDVVILLDSITRLARAYNLVIPPTGRSLSGGLDPGALLKPKKFFGAARNIEFGGSLTIIATALVDTGSRLDDIIYEEFKGTGNMELHLDRRLSERRIFPAIDINRSGTRRDDLLYTPEEAQGALLLRRSIANGSTQDATEQLMMLMERTPNNEQLLSRLKGWLAAIGK